MVFPVNFWKSHLYPEADQQGDDSFFIKNIGSKPGPYDNLGGWNGVRGAKEVQKGRDLCIPMADSCCWMAETNIIL